MEPVIVRCRVLKKDIIPVIDASSFCQASFKTVLYKPVSVIFKRLASFKRFFLAWPPAQFSLLSVILFSSEINNICWKVFNFFQKTWFLTAKTFRYTFFLVTKLDYLYNSSTLTPYYFYFSGLSVWKGLLAKTPNL